MDLAPAFCHHGLHSDAAFDAEKGANVARSSREKGGLEYLPIVVKLVLLVLIMDGFVVVSFAQDAKPKLSAKWLDQLVAANNSQPLKPIKALYADTYIFNYTAKSGALKASHAFAFLDQAKRSWQDSGDPKQLMELTRALPVRAEMYPNIWMQCEIFVRGNDNRNIQKHGILPGGDPCWTEYCFSRNLDIVSQSKTNLTQIFEQKSRWKRFIVTDLYIQPSQLTNPSIVLENDQNVLLRDGLETPNFHGEIEFERPSNMLLSRSIFAKNGAIIRKRWQNGFANYKGGDGTAVTLPALVASLDFDPSGAVERFNFLVLRDLKFNHQIDDKAFTVRLPKGMVVALFSGDTPGDEAEVARIKLEDSRDDASTLIPMLRASSKK